MKIKKVPIRMCVITREKLEKKELIRVVKAPDGNIFIDETGKANGKGAYLKKDIDVINKAKKNKILNRVLETVVDDNIYDKLNEIVNRKE